MSLELFFSTGRRPHPDHVSRSNHVGNPYRNCHICTPCRKFYHNYCLVPIAYCLVPYTRWMILEFFIFVIVLALAISLHEAAHCYMADYLGDPTPRALGRLTLNPIVHLDPIGFGLPFLLRLIGSPIAFGWGRPAPFDPYNLKNPKKDTLLIALAGPASNIILAVIVAIIYHLIPTSALFTSFTEIFVSLNLSLALFNLLPISPLDGSKIFLKNPSNSNNLLLLMLFIFPIINGHSLASLIISPIFNFLYSLLLF